MIWQLIQCHVLFKDFQIILLEKKLLIQVDRGGEWAGKPEAGLSLHNTTSALLHHHHRLHILNRVNTDPHKQTVQLYRWDLPLMNARYYDLLGDIPLLKWPCHIMAETGHSSLSSFSCCEVFHRKARGFMQIYLGFLLRPGWDTVFRIPTPNSLDPSLIFTV